MLLEARVEFGLLKLEGAAGVPVQCLGGEFADDQEAVGLSWAVGASAVLNQAGFLISSSDPSRLELSRVPSSTATSETC